MHRRIPAIGDAAKKYRLEQTTCRCRRKNRKCAKRQILAAGGSRRYRKVRRQHRLRSLGNPVAGVRGEGGRTWKKDYAGLGATEARSTRFAVA